MSRGYDLLEVRVYPKSSRPRVSVTEDGLFRVHVASAPDKGKANRELIGSLARHLGVPKGSIVIVRGERSREKLIKVTR